MYTTILNKICPLLFLSCLGWLHVMRKRKTLKNFNYPQQGLYVRNDLPTLAPKKSLNLETGWEFSKNPNPWEGGG